VTFSRRTETTAITIKPRTTTKATTIWIFFLLSIAEKKGTTAGKENEEEERERAPLLLLSLSLSLSLVGTRDVFFSKTFL